MKTMILILAAAASLTSCVSNNPSANAGSAGKKQGSAATDHKPQIDFWQNGGGACCAYHAQLHQAKAHKKN